MIGPKDRPWWAAHASVESIEAERARAARHLDRARRYALWVDTVAAQRAGPLAAGPGHHPSYHDLHVTTAAIPRARLFDLPYGLQVQCTRTGGWQLWQTASDMRDWAAIAGEYDDPGKWLVLDVGGHVIVDSRRPAAKNGKSGG